MPGDPLNDRGVQGTVQEQEEQAACDFGQCHRNDHTGNAVDDTQRSVDDTAVYILPATDGDKQDLQHPTNKRIDIVQPD